LLAEFLVQIGAIHWWDEEAQKVRFAAIHPRAIGATVTTITDAGNIDVEDGVDVDEATELRVTRSAVLYGVRDWSRDIRSQAKDRPAYTRVVGNIDTSAESANEYGDVIPRVIYAYWLSTGNAAEAASYAFKLVSRFRNAPQRVIVSVESKDASGLKLNADVDLSTQYLVNTAGAATTKQCRVVRREHPTTLDGKWKITLETTGFEGRWAFYASNSMSAQYPSDSSYAHYADNTTLLMPTGAAAYIYI
jgi:hypothetical protein